MLRGSSGIASSRSLTRTRTSATAAASDGGAGDSSASARCSRESQLAVAGRSGSGRSRPAGRAGNARSSVGQLAAGGQLGGAHVEHAAQRQHVLESSRPAPAPAAGPRRAGPPRPPGGSVTKVPPSRPRRDSTNPACRSVPDRLPQRHPTDAEPGGQRALGRQPVAVAARRPSLIACSNRSTVSSKALPPRTGRNAASSSPRGAGAGGAVDSTTATPPSAGPRPPDDNSGRRGRLVRAEQRQARGQALDLDRHRPVRLPSRPVQPQPLLGRRPPRRATRGLAVLGVPQLAGDAERRGLSMKAPDVAYSAPRPTKARCSTAARISVPMPLPVVPPAEPGAGMHLAGHREVAGNELLHAEHLAVGRSPPVRATTAAGDSSAHCRHCHCNTDRARSGGGRSVHGTVKGIVAGSWTPSAASPPSSASCSSEGSRSSSRGVRSTSPNSGHRSVSTPSVSRRRHPVSLGTGWSGCRGAARPPGSPPPAGLVG